MSALEASLGERSESARMAALLRYDILDTPPDGAFNHIAKMAARLFDVPIAIISLVDHDRIWFKSRHGLDVEQIGRDPGLCASAILQNDAYVLTDASIDPRSLANPLVAGEFGLRFYAAAQLRTSDGHNLGTLCVIDRKPRTVTDDQIEQLEALAALVIDQLELRLAARTAVSSLERIVEQREAALERAAVLSKETDHRVMNSLQQVSALLAMQGRQLGETETETAQQLILAAGRVTAVARVHQQIFQIGRDELPDCVTYLGQLCQELSAILGERGEIQVSGAAAKLPTNMVAPIGLAVNELVSNAAKNGARVMKVVLDREEDKCRLMVSDDGKGLPSGFDPETGSGLGMKVVRTVVRQLGGTLSYGQSDRLGGACFQIEFSISGAKADA